MKIVQLTAENVKRLSVVQITPDGNLVEITGKNGAGKSSLLDAIWYALAGQSVIAKSPIRKGEEGARIKLDMGELIVTRTFRRVEKPAPGEKDFTTKITVAGADGSEYRSPQGILDGLLGSLCFDPLAFTRMSPKEQFDEMRKFVPGVDFDKIDGQARADFNSRTEVNRERDKAKAAASVIDVPADTPDTLVDEKAITDAMASASTTNTEIETRRVRREQAQESIQTGRSAAAHARAEADQAITQAQQEAARILAEGERKRDQLLTTATEFETKADELEKKLAEAPELPKLVDTSELQAQLAAAKTVNAAVAKKKQKAELATKAETLDQESKALSDKIAAREQMKRDAIAAADLPVQGLGFGEGVILLNGLPFDQASDAERLRVSCAIAMASNPKLRVIRVRDGSLLDANAMKLLGAMADERDYQVWVETVDSRGRAAVVLEDGHVRAEPLAQQAAE